MFTPSARGIALTKSFEECRLTAYHGEDDPPDVWTIGWGETESIEPGDVWTQAQADANLVNRLNVAGHAVLQCVDVQINQNQFDALTDLAYNIGSEAFTGSTLVKCINSHDFAGASAQFLRWDYADGQQSAGLERRRVAEQALFNAAD
jgi:lysozyme